MMLGRNFLRIASAQPVGELEILREGGAGGDGGEGQRGGGSDEFHEQPKRLRSGLDSARRAFDAAYVRAALARCGHRPGAAARELGLTRQGLAKLMARLGLRPHVASGPLRPAM